MVDILIIFVVTAVGYCLGLLSYYPIWKSKRQTERQIRQIPAKQLRELVGEEK